MVFISEVDMRMLKWMSDSTLKDRIKDENIWGKLEVSPIGDEMRETHLRWFGYVQRRLIE